MYQVYIRLLPGEICLQKDIFAIQSGTKYVSTGNDQMIYRCTHLSSIRIDFICINYSYFHYWSYIILGWNSFERLLGDDRSNNVIKYIKGGFSNLLQTLFGSKISQDKIQLNSIVKRISIHKEEQYVNIEIIRKNQEIIKYQAKHVVCTLSIGCLKKTMHDIFVPPLPYAKQIYIEKLGFGTINKVCFNYYFFFNDIINIVKYELKGVLKCIRVKNWTPSPDCGPQLSSDSSRFSLFVNKTFANCLAKILFAKSG